MKTIYLDMNIYADYMDSSRPSHNELKEKIDNLKKEYTFLYSPAHMEEIARIHRSQDNENQAIDNITKKMMIISELTNNHEALPSYESIIIRQEHPKECLKRVLKDYELTLFVEKLNAPTEIKKDLNNKFKEKYNINSSQIGNIEAENFLTNNSIKNIFNIYLKELNENIKDWNYIKNSHREIEETISILFAFLDDIGYNKGSDRQIVSNIHDNTHAIYATVADVFVTADEKFYKRVKAIYSYLGVPTKIYLKNEFIREDNK